MAASLSAVAASKAAFRAARSACLVAKSHLSNKTSSDMQSYIVHFTQSAAVRLDRAMATCLSAVAASKAAFFAAHSACLVAKESSEQQDSM